MGATGKMTTTTTTTTRQKRMTIHRFLIALIVFLALANTTYYYSNNVLSSMMTFSNETTTTAPDDSSPFANLELFVSAFPGNPNDDEKVNGFTELQSTLIRSVQFFWPVNYFKMTIVLDDSVYNTTQEQEDMTAHVKSMFKEGYAERVSIKYNPLSNNTIYGKGHAIQQLVMLWADNFTDAEYIGFVDDDTIFTRLVHAEELFEESYDKYGQTIVSRPRVIVRHASTAPIYGFPESNYRFFHWPAVINAMTSFPIIVKRSHLQEIRDEVLRIHNSNTSANLSLSASSQQKQQQFTYFDQYYLSFFHNEIGGCGYCFSQFCIMMEYLFRYRQDEYRWHFDEPSMKSIGKMYTFGRREIMRLQREGKIAANENNSGKRLISEDMLTPFPRVATHATYYYKRDRKSIKTKTGRFDFVSSFLREGYCYSIPLKNRSLEINQDRCQTYFEQDDDKNIITPDGDRTDIYERGEWSFERGLDWWVTSNRTRVVKAHDECMARNVLFYDWDQEELDRLF